MELVDDVEALGEAVQAGSLGRSDAVQLMVMSAEGGLTETGAALLIDEWQTARHLFKREHDRAAEALNRIAEGMGNDR